MNNVSQDRLQTSLNVVGGAAIHNALNKVTFTVTNGSGQPVAGAKVTGDCGDGVRNLGESGAGGIAQVFVPHATCDFKVANGNAVGSADDVAVAGDRAVAMQLTGASGDVGGTVPAHARRWRSARRPASARSRPASRGTTSRRRPRT